MIQDALRSLARPRGLALAFAAAAAWYAVLCVVCAPVSDADVWWVAAAGRELLHSGQFPSRNLFSFTDPDTPWIMHEWLLGPLYAWGLERLGPAFFVAAALLLLAAALALLTRATIVRAKRPLAGVLLAAVSCLFFLRRLQSSRPTAVSLLFPLGLAQLVLRERFTLRSAVGCVLLEGVWANTHGSFPLGIALMLLGAIEQPRDRPLRVYATVGAAAITLVNPYGARLHQFVWGYLLGQAGIYQDIHLFILEFHSMWQEWGALIGISELIGFACIAGMALAALARPGQRLRGAVCVGLLLLAARQTRNLELAGLLGSVLLVPWADAWVASWDRTRESRAEACSYQRRAAAFLVLPACAIALVGFAIQLATRQPEAFIDERGALVRALATTPSGTRTFVPFRSAGLAIWYGYPRGIRVFYDSRNDCYSSATLRGFAELDSATSSPERARQLLLASRTQRVIVPPQHALARHLARIPEFTQIAAGQLHTFVRIEP